MMRYTVLLLLLVLTTSTGTKAQQHDYPVQANSQPLDQSYRCPPCGCSLDSLVLSQDGVCASCAMPLVKTNQGSKASLDHKVQYLFENGRLGLFYPKLIYPIFAIAILAGFYGLILSYRGSGLNLYLVLLVLVLSLYAFKNQLFGVQHGLTSTNSSLFAPISFIMLMGPLIWFYTQSMTDGAFKFWPKYKWHVVPALLIFLVYLLLWIAPRDTQLAFLSTPFEPVFGHLEQIMALSFAMMYWGLSVGHFRTWKHSLMSNNYVKIKWMQRFFAVVAAFVILWLSLIFINYWLYDFGVATVTYNPLWVAISAVLLWLGFEVYSNPKFFLLTKKANGAILNKVEPEDLALYQKKLHDLMVEQKLYIDPTLSLNKLAKAMDTNPRFLSSLINGGLGTTFYDLINRYRIDEVKRLLKDPSNKNLTIEAIAHHAGFNSKSTFNSAFKKFNQMTPREFIKGHLNGA